MPTKNAKLLSVLAAFSHERPALTLSEISRATGLPLSTAHRLADELRCWGALERDGRQRYTVGLRLWEVGSLAPRAYGLRDSALPFMGDLYETTRENVQLGVLDGGEVLLIEVLSGHRAVELVAGMGGRLPLHASGLGHVLLAHASAQFVERVLSGPLPAYTPHTLTAPARLRSALAAIHETGAAVSREALGLGSISVAAPITGRRGAVVAALSLVVPVDGAHTAALVPAVRTAANGISRVLASGPGER
ncbi:IclR family transcriptional regulator [Streptomyces sp. NPDC050560]|uniref:IclR family transcriptional regulator n=1 Tax=Streptomyces sp. NPDC050560 TaxID=3365630 RepID=UPI0037B86B5D